MNLYRKRLPINGLRRGIHHVPGLPRPLDLGAPVTPLPPYNYRINSLVTSQLDVAFAASLEFPETFVGSLNASMSFYLLDFMATLPEMIAPEYWGDYGVIWGLGIRVGISTSKIDGNLKASIAGVAANAELHAGTTSYSAAPIGLGPDAITKGGSFFKDPPVAFNANAVELLGAGLQELSLYLVQQAASRPPVPVYVVALRQENELAKLQAVSSCWALNMIGDKGMSYDAADAFINRADALQRMIDPLAVQAIYHVLVNNAGSDQPSQPQREKANVIRNMQGVF